MAPFQGDSHILIEALCSEPILREVWELRYCQAAPLWQNDVEPVIIDAHDKWRRYFAQFCGEETAYCQKMQAFLSIADAVELTRHVNLLQWLLRKLFKGSNRQYGGQHHARVIKVWTFLANRVAMSILAEVSKL